MTLKQLIWCEVKNAQYARARFHIMWSSKSISPVKYQGHFITPMCHLINSKFFHVNARSLQVRKENTAEISKVKGKQGGQVTLGKKVTQAGKDATYTGVIVLGVGVTGILFYLIGRELFSGQSPSGLYGKALKQCRNHPEVMDELGDPIKGQGEMNRRGRARFVSHVEYEKEGVKYMRIKFYLKGILRNGTAHLEVKQNDSGKYETRYLFVEVDKYPYKTIIVDDNR